MKSFAHAAIFLLVANAVLAVDAEGVPKAINGTWLPVKAELAGKAMPEAVLKSITLKLADAKYVVTIVGEPKGGETVDKGEYTIDESTTPKGMVIKGTDGPNKGKTFLCIFELDGDTLRVCYDLSGMKQPAEFKTAEGTLLYLVTYKRKAADEAKK